MTLRVNDPKTYALTAEREYDVLQELDRRVRIINDNNTSAWYYRSVFHTAPVTEEQPVEAAIEVPVPTFDAIMATVTVGPGEHATHRTISFRVLDHPMTTIQNLTSRSGTSISCGIQQLGGVNHVVNCIAEALENHPANLNADLVRQLVPTLSREVILDALEVAAEGNQAFVTISTNTNSVEHPILATFLDEMACAMPTRENPNSGNEIVLWVIDMNDLPIN